MAYEVRPNTGSVFNNDRRETERHPNVKGSALIVCPHCNQETEFWVDGWIKRTKEDKPWQSLSFKQKQQRTSKPVRDEDVPF